MAKLPDQPGEPHAPANVIPFPKGNVYPEEAQSAMRELPDCKK